MTVDDVSLQRRNGWNLFLCRIDGYLKVSVAIALSSASMTTTQQTEADDVSRIVHCHSCDFSEAARSQTHAHAIGRRHYHRKGHAVYVEVSDE